MENVLLITRLLKNQIAWRAGFIFLSIFLILGICRVRAQCLAVPQQTLSFNMLVSEQSTIEQLSFSETYVVSTGSPVSCGDHPAYGVLYTEDLQFQTATNNGGMVTSSLTTPFGMTFDADGNLYIANSLVANNIVLYSATGEDQGIVNNISGLSYPTGLAYYSTTPNNYLYVCDYVSDTVMQFAISGTSASSATPITGTGSAALVGPYGIVIDSSGNAYVTSFLANKVSKITGTTVANFINSGLNSPAGITRDSNGNIYVANYGNSTISKYSSSGSLLGNFPARVKFPLGIICLDNSIYVASHDGIQISKFTTAGRFLGTMGILSSYRVTAPSDGIGPSNNTGPAWLAAGPNGQIYVSSQTANIVARFHPKTGAFQGLAAGVGAYGYTGLALDSTSKVYAADLYGNVIHVFPPIGSTPVAQSALLSSPVLNGPYGLAIDPASGILYVTNYDGNTISAFSPNGSGGFNDLGIVGYTQGKNPIAIAIRPSDSFIFVVSANSNVIEAFPPGGWISSVYATVNDQGCSGLTFDSSNNLYVTTKTSNQVLQFTSFGNPSTVYQNTNLNFPMGLLFSPTSPMIPNISSYLCVANSSSNNIFIFGNGSESFYCHKHGDCIHEGTQAIPNPVVSTASTPRNIVVYNVQASTQ